MNLFQAVKMAWKSIWGKKGRSILTMLGIIIGIAAVMTIVSAMNGFKEEVMEQYAAMGSNKLNVQIYSFIYDSEGNSLGKDYFPDLYNYCKRMSKYIEGVTPQAGFGATVIYGTKNSDNMEYDWETQTGERSPDLYYASDQYSICNNLVIQKGRDLASLDIDCYHQVCVLGSQAAKSFFGSVDPIGKNMSFNGKKFTVVGVYASRLDEDEEQSNFMGQIDNFIILPYTARRVLGGELPSMFVVKARDQDSLTEVSSRLNGFLKGLVDSNTGDFYVDSNTQTQQYLDEQMGMISMVLGGIAAISLLVGGIGIMNIMLVTVTERTREIGIRRAIGAQRSSIVTQFLIEAAMLCSIGGLIGILLGAAGSYVIGQLLFQIEIYPAPWITVAAFTLSLALGLIFGIYPAAKASKLQPVEALRAE